MACQSNKVQQLLALQSGKGIQYLLNQAYKILGNPVLIQDMEYNLICQTQGITTDDWVWNEFEQRGKLSEQTIDFFTQEGFVDDVANSTLQNGITYLISDNLKYDRIFGQLYSKNHTPVADLILLACEKPFDDDSQELVKVLCDVLTKELSHIAFYQEYGQAYKNRIIKQLIDGSIENNKMYTGHIANIDKNLKQNIFVAVADVSQSNSNQEDIKQLLSAKLPEFDFLIYKDYIVILMSWDKIVPLGEIKELTKLRKFFVKENIFAGVSSCFENLFNLQSYYKKAVDALQYGKNIKSTERVFLYDEIKIQQP